VKVNAYLVYNRLGRRRMWCCRRRRLTEVPRVDKIPCLSSSETDEADEEIEAWYAESNRLDPCPICFEEPADETEIICYAEVSTHSWANHDRCDGHGICKSCLQRHVEVQLVEQGVFDVRCPGGRCQYHLLKDDIDNALRHSAEQARAYRIYTELRQNNGSSRLQDAIFLALQQRSTADGDDSDSWLWAECQACPRCFVLAHRADGCAHLACRCGCHFCFICGGAYPDQDDWNGISACICEEHRIYQEGRAYLAAWMCLKNESHVALGPHHAAVRAYHEDHVPLFIEQRRRDRLRRERAREHEETAEAWARAQVCGTVEVLRARDICESFASVLVRAGLDADISGSNHCVNGTAHVRQEAGFEGLLVSSTTQARADESEDVFEENAFEADMQCDDVLGYVLDYTAIKTQRRAAHGAPRRFCTEKAWVGGQKVKVKALAHSRQQKHSLEAGDRRRNADVRQVRRQARFQRMRADF